MKIIEKFADNKTDTGSVEVQVALLTTEIKQLADHLKKHPKELQELGQKCAEG